MNQSIAEKLSVIQAKQDDAAKLRKSLSMSAQLRAMYNLPMTGTVGIQKVKPSGASMSETDKHIVRILHNRKVVHQESLTEFNKRLAS